MPEGDRLRVYIDADVLLASAASPSEYSAGQVILTLSEITLIDAVTSELAVEECERNLREKLPEALAPFHLILKRAVEIVPRPSQQVVRAHAGMADWKDVPHLASALQHRCRYLATYYTDDYRPGHPELQVLQPGPLVRRIRDHLASLRSA